jgi:branched-chain amino acid aminotransferase
VLLDEAGLVTEGPGFNIFALHGTAITTPDRGVLEGITRMSVMELAGEAGLTCHAAPLSADALRDADEVFIATTAGGIMPVSRIDGRILCNDRPGPVTTRLRDLFWTKRAQGWHATPIDYDAAEIEDNK